MQSLNYSRKTLKNNYEEMTIPSSHGVPYKQKHLPASRKLKLFLSALIVNAYLSLISRSLQGLPISLEATVTWVAYGFLDLPTPHLERVLTPLILLQPQGPPDCSLNSAFVLVHELEFCSLTYSYGSFFHLFRPLLIDDLSDHPNLNSSPILPPPPTSSMILY